MGTSPHICCPHDCLIAADDFNRSNSTNPGCKWRKVGASDWQIVSNELRCVTPGPLITTVSHWGSTRPTAGQSTKYALQLLVTLTGINDGVTTWGVIVGFYDANNFTWIKFEYDAVQHAVWPTFYKRSNGQDDVLIDKNTYQGSDRAFPLSEDEEQTVPLTVCYSRHDWTVFSNNAEIAWSLCGHGNEDLPQDPQFGLVGFLMGRFDDWNYHVHWENNLECDVCSCFCQHPDDDGDFACFPATVYAKFVPHPNNGLTCPNLDNLSVELRQGIDEWGLFHPSPSKLYWTSEPLNPDGQELNPIVLQCGLDPSIRVDFVRGAFVRPGYGPPVQYVDWSASTCHPLRLVFRNYSTFMNTCWLDPPGETGVRPGMCPDCACMEDSPANQEAIGDMRWDVILTDTPQ